MLITLKGGPHDGTIMERAIRDGLSKDQLIRGTSTYILRGIYSKGPNPYDGYDQYAVYEYKEP